MDYIFGIVMSCYSLCILFYFWCIYFKTNRIDMDSDVLVRRYTFYYRNIKQLRNKW